MEIQVVDTVDPSLVRTRLNVKGMGKDAIEMTAGPDGVARMVSEVIKVAKSAGAISVLRLYGHGNSGIINVAGGEDDQSDQLSAISLANLPRIAASLRRLTPYFAPGARVELQGCVVASGSDGEKLLLELAKIWGVRVQASPGSQPIGAIQFPGPVYEANPQGGLLCIPRTEMTRSP